MTTTRTCKEGKLHAAEQTKANKQNEINKISAFHLKEKVHARKGKVWVEKRTKLKLTFLSKHNFQATKQTPAKFFCALSPKC